jgi:hypothetical protein
MWHTQLFTSRIWFPAEEINFFICTSSRPNLGPTQPPIRWVPEVLSTGMKRPGREADLSPPSSAEELYLVAQCLTKQAQEWLYFVPCTATFVMIEWCRYRSTSHVTAAAPLLAFMKAVTIGGIRTCSSVCSRVRITELGASVYILFTGVCKMLSQSNVRSTARKCTGSTTVPRVRK